MTTELLISHSSRGTWRSCERRFQFIKLLGAQTVGNDASTASGAGQALHVGFQSWLAYKDIDRAVYDMMLAYPIQFETNPMADRSLEACYATLLAMVQHINFGRYELAWIDIAGEHRPMVEVPFIINLLNFSLSDTAQIPVRYRGYIDIVLYDRQDDVYIVVDIKSHRNNRLSDMTPVYHYDDQCLPYALVLERLLNRPINNLTVKYLSVYIDHLNPVPRMYQFEKNAESMRDWAQGLLYDLQQMKTCYRLDWFPRRGSACVSYGAQVCKFYEICGYRGPEQAAAVEALKPAEIKPDDFQAWISVDLDLRSAA